MDIQNNFVLKKSISRALAIAIAVVVSYFFSQAEKYWLVLATLVVMQTTFGAEVRQGLQRFVLLLLGLIIAFFLQTYIDSDFNTFTLGVIIFCLGFFIAKKTTGQFFIFSPYFIVSFVILISLLTKDFIDLQILQNRVRDVALGAVIGIAVNVIVFPSRVDVEFRQRILPLFEIYSYYLTAIMALLFKKSHADDQALQQRLLLEQNLQLKNIFFPVWVYEPGLSLTLQSGHRHFLIMSERLAEILMSMQRVANYHFSKDLLHDLEKPLKNFFDETQKIFSALILVLNLKKLTEPVGDLKEELAKVEKTFDSIQPISPEWMELSDEYVMMASFIEDLKDLRTTLVNLGNALRASQKAIK